MALNKPLLGVNFFAGDVVAGLGPYLAIYLLSVLKWAPGSIGIALALSTICTVIVQTPAGGIVDTVRWKRGLLAICALTIAISAVSITFFHSSFAIYAAQMAIGVALAFVGPSMPLLR
jgi:predicted MFS family arabinose efflux permease